jgi:hypothetical protein
MDKFRELKVINLYQIENKTCTEISQELKIQRKSVYRILKRLNVDLKITETKKCKLCENIIGPGRNVCGTCTTNIRRYRIKKKAVEYKGCKCNRCSWSGDISGFDFHHSDPTQKEFEISGKIIASMSWEKVKSEIDKCELLCALCHRLEHSNYKNELFLKEANNY